MEQTADVTQYWEIVKRRKFHIIIPAVSIFCLSIVIALILPPVYKSTGTILIETQEIPEDIVRTTVTGYVEERLQMISQIVMSRSNLLEVINRFGLYEDLRDRYTTEEIIEKMREDIIMEPIQTEVMNPRSGRPGSATIAFNLSYEGKDRRQVGQVANVLCSSYLEENLRNREQKAETTFQFLEGQLDKLRTEILDTEAEIATFKQRNVSVLPELMEVNLQTMERLQREIDQVENRIRNLEDREIYLKGQLATVEPVRYAVNVTGNRVLTPREELEALRSEYLALKATHSENHPDVIALRKRVEAMGEEISTRQDLRDRRERLQSKETELALLLKKFSRRHPDVIQLEKEVEGLRGEVADLSKMQLVMKTEEEKPENPSYINLQTQIASTRLDIESAKTELTALKAQYEDYQKRVEITPQVEQQYRALQRDYATAQAQYQETRDRLMTAKEAKGLEENRMGEKFTLVDPPITPEKPDKPNRLAIILIGVVLAMGAGVGFGSMAEYMDQSVYTATELAQVAGHPVLAVIPELETLQDRAKKRWKVVTLVVVAVGVVVGGLLVLHVAYQPLDVIWIRAMRHLQIGL